MLVTFVILVLLPFILLRKTYQHLSILSVYFCDVYVTVCLQILAIHHQIPEVKSCKNIFFICSKLQSGHLTGKPGILRKLSNTEIVREFQKKKMEKSVWFFFNSCSRNNNKKFQI